MFVEGGPVTTIEEWIAQRSPDLMRSGGSGDGGGGRGAGHDGANGKRPMSSSGSSSSGLSSVDSEMRDVTKNGDTMDLS